MNKRQRKILYRIGIAAALLVGISLAPVEGLWKLLLFALPYLIVGWDILYSALRNIINGQIFDENFLMTVATVGAFAIGEYPEAVAVMLFYQVGELFQNLAVGKSRKSIAALMDIRPLTAVVLRDGKEVTVSPEEVELGELIVVRPGEKIPLDGIVCEGATSVDTSSLTGESIPADKGEGDSVVSGSVNLNGEIRVKTTALYIDSTVSKILALVEHASARKAKTESFITRFAKYYTPVVVISAALLAVLPPLILQGGWSSWIHRALVFLVVSCPCALVVSVPLTFFGGIGGCARKGILVKGAVSLEKLSQADTFVFDKTGTLTKGRFSIETVCPVGMTEEELLRLASAAERHSNHPVARCIAESYSGEPVSVTEVTEIPGRGLTAFIDGEKYYFGNQALLQMAGVEGASVDSGAVVYVAKDKMYLGYICVRDEVKDDAAAMLGALRAQGVTKTVMLTGDNCGVAEHVAMQTGIDAYYAELLPGDKVVQVEALQQAGGKVAFVGDGINDAPVLTRADIGIAMGALGSDAAIEAADVVLIDDRLSKISQAVSASRKTMSIVKQNIVFALGVKGVILVLGALGLASMWIAVFGDVGVTVLAVLNAMRTLASR